MTVIAARSTHMEGLVTAKKSATVGHILRAIADKNLHRMLLVDDDDPQKLVAVVSLRHVLRFLTSQNVYQAAEVPRSFGTADTAVRDAADAAAEGADGAEELREWDSHAWEK